MTRRQQLHDGWTVRAVGGGPTDGVVPLDVADHDVPATVPGVVHTDLLAAQLISDPYVDCNETDVAWIGRTGWRYETTFDWQPGTEGRVDLVCEGLDTVACVQLNGAPVADTTNMHRSYRFPVTHLLRPGPNRLAVTFASALDYAETQRDVMGALPIPNTASVYPINFIRKMACNFGWDWGPVLVTAGIWRPIGLHAWSGARLAGVRPAVTVEDGTGRVRVDVDIERTGDRVPCAGDRPRRGGRGGGRGRGRSGPRRAGPAGARPCAVVAARTRPAAPLRPVRRTYPRRRRPGNGHRFSGHVASTGGVPHCPAGYF